ncbi:hypothetical protein [Hymenobacter sp. B81]|uniref:hypothetical protein n=1 Tax=Hymenobacter sp. B81 TaxID=3344878 RepID=UPI0037DD3D7D
MTLRRPNFVRPALITACILLIPLVAMQFTQEVNWTFSDFVIMGALIFGTGLAFELLLSQGGSVTYRMGALLAVAAGFLSVWVNLAVGIIGSGPNPANLLLGAPFVVAIVGAMMVRLRASGLALAMLAAGLVQFLAPLVALLFWKPEFNLDVTRGLWGNLIFVALWLLSAWLFRQAAGPSRPAQSNAHAA